MAGADDIVKQALRLVIGGGDDAAESALRAFAETKFKTPQGKPMRLYHMTPNDITEFRASPENRSGPAVFLSPYPDFQPAHHQSAERGPSGELTEQFKEGANVMPVYADVRNPLVLDHPRKIKEAATKYQGGDRNFPRIITPEARAALEADGYDGVVFGGDNPIPYGDRPMDARLGYQEGRGEEFLVFDPKRVKSAVSNTGEYDFANPDITKADGGQVREGYQTRGRALATPFERALAYLKREYGNLPPRPVDEAFRLQGEDLVRKSRNLEGKIPILGNEKFGKPLSEMQAEYDQVRPLVEYRERRPHDLVKENAVIYPAVGDLSAAGKRLSKVGDTSLVLPTDLQGGFEFSRDAFGTGPNPAGWASRQGAAKTMADRLSSRTKEGEIPYLTSYTMGPQAVDSTHMVANTIISMMPNSKVSSADIAKFDAEMKRDYPGWPGIMNTKKALEFMNARNRPGTHLSDFAKKLDKKEYRAAGFPDVGEIRFAVSEPRLLGTPLGSTGFSLMKVEPTTDTLTEGIQHGTYANKIKSPEGYSGGFQNITPSRLMFPNWFEKLHPNAKIDPQKAYQSALTQFPKQKATNEWADNIEKYWEENPMPWGYAYGGEVDDDDIDDAIRIAKDVGGATPQNDMQATYAALERANVPQSAAPVEPRYPDKTARQMAARKAAIAEAMGGIKSDREPTDLEYWNAMPPEAKAEFAAQYPELGEEMRLASEVDYYENVQRAKASQPYSIQSMTHDAPVPRTEMKINMPLFGGEYSMGTAPYDVAEGLQGMAQGAYDFKTMPAYFFPPTAPFALAADVVESRLADDPVGLLANVMLTPAGGRLAKDISRPVVNKALSLTRGY